jgi:hypothetical protein
MKGGLYPKMLAKAIEKGLTMRELAKRMETKLPNLTNKRMGRSKFNVSEVEKICLLLDIGQEEIGEIFFPNVKKRGE